MITARMNVPGLNALLTIPLPNSIKPMLSEVKIDDNFIFLR